MTSPAPEIAQDVPAERTPEAGRRDEAVKPGPDHGPSTGADGGADPGNRQPVLVMP
jgi:hypothetical protein